MLVYCLSVAAVVSLRCTAVTFRYQYHNDIDYEFVFRTNGRKCEHLYFGTAVKIRRDQYALFVHFFRCDNTATSEIVHSIMYGTHLQFMSPL